MPEIVKKYTFEKMCSLTKNYQYFYYQGETRGIADLSEFLFLGFEFHDFNKLKEELIKISSFVDNILKNDLEINDTFYINYGYHNYKSNDGYILSVKLFGKKNYGDFLEEQFSIAERFEIVMRGYIVENNLVPEIITNDLKKFEQLTIEMTWNPRHPDPNYMFLIKEA